MVRFRPASEAYALTTTQLWTAQGAVTMAYPTEGEKGKAFSLFWTMYQCGGTIGSIIPICLNWNSTQGSLSDATVRRPLTLDQSLSNVRPQSMRSSLPYSLWELLFGLGSFYRPTK